MKIKLFNPEGIKPDNYRHTYPELERESAYAELSARALIFVWWYSNPISELVLDVQDDYDRAAEALKKSGYNPSKIERENILKLQFDSNMAGAIQKMSSYDPGIRFRSYKIVRTVFNEYEKLIKRGPVSVPDSVDEEDNKSIDTDYKKNPYFVDRYVVTSARIVDALPGLIAKLEEGFGVLDISGTEVAENDSASTMRDWHLAKEFKE